MTQMDYRDKTCGECFHMCPSSQNGAAVDMHECRESPPSVWILAQAKRGIQIAGAQVNNVNIQMHGDYPPVNKDSKACSKLQPIPASMREGTVGQAEGTPIEMTAKVCTCDILKKQSRSGFCQLHGKFNPDNEKGNTT